MLRVAVRTLLAAAVLLGAVAVHATGSDLPSQAELQRRLANLQPESGAVMVEPPALAASGVTVAAQTQQAYEAALRAYYQYREKGYQQRLLAFDWQAWSSKAIFFIVVLLVLAGIVFAALQFGAGLRRRGKAGDPPPATTEIVIDMKGIQVRSPVLGVVVLAISLAFFYLYLVYVYPIVSVF
jgi:hypothetical protein